MVLFLVFRIKQVNVFAFGVVAYVGVNRPGHPAADCVPDPSLNYNLINPFLVAAAYECMAELVDCQLRKAVSFEQVPKLCIESVPAEPINELVRVGVNTIEYSVFIVIMKGYIFD